MTTTCYEHTLDKARALSEHRITREPGPFYRSRRDDTASPKRRRLSVSARAVIAEERKYAEEKRADREARKVLL